MPEAADHKKSAERVVNHKRHEGFPYRSALQELKKHFGGLLTVMSLCTDTGFENQLVCALYSYNTVARIMDSLETVHWHSRTGDIT